MIETRPWSLLLSVRKLLSPRDTEENRQEQGGKLYSPLFLFGSGAFTFFLPDTLVATC